MTRTLSAIHAALLWYAGLSAGDPSISLPSPHHPTQTGTLYPVGPAVPFPRPRPVGAMTPNKRYLVSR